MNIGEVCNYKFVNQNQSLIMRMLINKSSGYGRIDIKKSIVSLKSLLLDIKQWLSTCGSQFLLGVTYKIYCMSDVYLIILNSSKLQLLCSNEIILWLSVTIS